MYVRVPGNTANITLTKMYPRTATEARARNDNYVDFVVNGKNTSTTKELYYTLDINDGAEVNNKTRIPRNYIKIDLQEKINSVYTYVAEAVTLSNFSFSDVVPPNTTIETQREFRLRVWISDEVLISDTETGRTYTESQFANLYANYNIEVNGVDRTYVAPPLCIRATTLNTEECTNTSSSYYCQSDNYELNETITYGNPVTTPGELHTGDAFDCNVDGTGYNQRFYYVSNYYDTNTQTFDSTTAALIYYSNTVSGGASTSGSSYATQAQAQALEYTCTESNGCNWYGPIGAVNDLPTTSQWSNVELKTNTRKIWSCYSGDCGSTDLLTSGGTITNPFSYTGKAARLLTLPELVNGCKGTINNNTSLSTTGSLKTCNFIFEGTRYANSSSGTYGPWLETPLASSSFYMLLPHSDNRSVSSYAAKHTVFGARPVIDVPINRIEY